MNKLIQRIGTQPQRFNFQFRINTFQRKTPTQDCFRVCLKRQDKVFYSSYFKPQTNKETQIKEVIKFSATMFYNKKEQEYQAKMFQFILLKCDKQREVQEFKEEIDLEEVIINYHVSKVFQDRGNVMKVDITGEGDKQSLSPVRKSCPQYQPKSQNTISSIQKNLVERGKNGENGERKAPIQLITFDDDAVESEGPIRNTVDGIRTGLISSSKEKEVSFRNVRIEDQKGSVERDRRRERRKSRENINSFNKNPSISTVSYETSVPATPHNPPIITIPHSFQTNLQDKLNQIENHLGEERMRKSTLYENMSHQKDELINKLKSQNSELNSSINRYINELQFSNKEIKNMEGRYDTLYKKSNKLLQEQTEWRQERQRLASENEELLSTISKLKSNPNHSAPNRNQREVSSEAEKRSEMEIQKLRKQIQKYKKFNKRLDEEVEALQAEKLLVQSKYQQILKKYKIISGELSSEKLRYEELRKKMEGEQIQYIRDLKRKEEEISEVKRQRKQLETKLLKPGDGLSKQEHQLLKQKMERLEGKISEDTRENKELQQFLKKQIEKYKKENAMLYQKMGIIQKSYTDQLNVSVNREKSLNRALAEKDKRISEQAKELSKVKETLAENNKFIESEKVDLIMKMRVLNEELRERKEVGEELQVAEQRNKELQNKIRMAASENEQVMVEIGRLRQEVMLSEKNIKDHNSALSLVEQLQGQLVKVNMKMATTMQIIFQNDPGLAQSIIQNLRRG